MTGQCTETALDGERCPWAAVEGLTVCLHHLDRAASQAVQGAQDQRIANRQRRRELAESTRQLVQHLEASMPELERRSRKREAEARQARKDAWHARRREEEAERRERAAEARKAAQIAAQDPATRQTCRTCGRSLPLDAFHRDRAALLGRKTRCKTCWSAYDRERRSKR